MSIKETESTGRKTVGGWGRLEDGEEARSKRHPQEAGGGSAWGEMVRVTPRRRNAGK